MWNEFTTSISLKAQRDSEQCGMNPPDGHFRWATRDSHLFSIGQTLTRYASTEPRLRHLMYPARLKTRANHCPSSSGNFREIFDQANLQISSNPKMLWAKRWVYGTMRSLYLISLTSREKSWPPMQTTSACKQNIMPTLYPAALFACVKSLSQQISDFADLHSFLYQRSPRNNSEWLQKRNVL